MRFFAFALFSFLINVLAVAQSERSLPSDAFEKMMESAGVQLIDVRTPEEFGRGAIDGSVNMNVLAKDFASQITSLDKSKTVLVYCLSGSRSQKAAAILRKDGFRVYELDGGIMAWSKSGKPVTRPAAASGMSLQTFRAEVTNDKLVLVDFHALWCGPCKKMAPDLEALKERYKDRLILLKVDADANPEVLDKLNIQALPTLQIYRNGERVWSHTGYLNKKDIERKIQENL